MPLILILLAGAGAFWWYKQHQSTGAAGPSGAAFVPSSNTVYYLAIDPNSLVYFQADPNWQVQTAADGTPAIYTPSTTGPTSGPSAWTSQFGVQDLAVAMWVGPAGSSAASYVTSYGPMVSF